VLEGDGLYAVRTGVASNTENGVVSSGVVDAETVRGVIAWFDERQLPASWLVAEDEACAATAATLEAAACRPEQSGWEMRAALDTLDLEQDAADVYPVGSEDQLEAWLDVAGACGWFESEDERRAWRALQRGLAEPTRLYVAVRDGKPAGMASAFFDEEVVLLTAVAVLDRERRRGVGRALAIARLREARARGCTLAVLDPSPEGGKLYESLGFDFHRQPEDRWFYLPTPDASAQ
jgi:GNAT superfamily N-acetyltransferase